ncbi:MAG: tRNA preQ1(34) S-adenosylmethionine ribosyltransferase-isomerase QueA [Dehalococcoidia bacterium]|nr:tRNA preQ1(34) S-adenosylmethionine ribosyltransferase-isomerase QueA [Dehalococcoidia bacterium]
MSLHTSDFNYDLPPKMIAQTPIEPRDAARLMVVDRATGALQHRRFRELPGFLRPGDVMVFNDSRVIPARLAGKKSGTGGEVEILLLRRLESCIWEALVKPARRVRKGMTLDLGTDVAVQAVVLSEGEAGIRTLRFSNESCLPALGEIALPPYIHEPLEKPERYQTVYAEKPGSVAAPTAGLHFTPQLLQRVRDKGVKCLFVTLHVGLDTFRPVQEEDPRKHRIHREYGVITEEVASELARAKAEGRRVVSVGTTSVRMVEAAAQTGDILPFDGWVDLFILPGYRFKVVDAMVTNFHLPRSTLLMLVSAFAGKELIQKVYREAIKEKYRFYSFGDAMLIL